ncbi:MAG: AraC family transcriptional regulator [Pseudolabrys sp.]|jgi:AraC-like DNA-binding protein
MERSENAALNSSTPSEPQFDCLANSLIQLLETAKQDLERDREAAKALLAKASSILQSEIERHSGANDSGTGGLAGWQIARVRAFIDKNLHGTIHIRDLSAVVRRSAAHFARSFKHSFGEPPHAYVMRRRFEKACHLMIASSESLSQIALSVGFSDQSHFCKRFKQALGQSPSNWRRERELFGTLWRRLPEKQGSKVRSLQIIDRQQAREKLHENRSTPQPVLSSAD